MAKKIKEKTIPMTVRLPESMVAKIKDLANLSGVSPSFLLGHIVASGFIIAQGILNTDESERSDNGQLQ